MTNALAMRINCRMAYEELLRRIDEAIAKAGLSERKACLNAGLKVDAIRTIRRGNAPRAETLVALAKELGVNPAFLLDVSGEGAASLPAEPSEGLVQIDELDVRGGGGPGGAHSFELVVEDGNLVDQVERVTAWSVPADLTRPVTRASATSLKIITIVGNSMVPDFPPGQKVLVDISDTTPTPPGVFVVWDGLALVVKTVEHVPFSDPPTVRIASKNPDFQPYERTLEEAYIQGRVIGSWRWT